MEFGFNATGREFQRHGPATEKQNNIYKAYSYTINENNKLQGMVKVDISDKINDQLTVYVFEEVLHGQVSHSSA